jgi:hypothetical protein
VTVKDLAAGSQETVPQAEATQYIRQILAREPAER